MKEMMDEVNERLDRRGVTHVKSKNTILRDLDEIRNRFYAKIITFRDEDDERIVKYRYADIDFSISWLLPILLEHRCQIELIFYVKCLLMQSQPIRHSGYQTVV